VLEILRLLHERPKEESAQGTNEQASLSHHCGKEPEIPTPQLDKKWQKECANRHQKMTVLITSCVFF